MVPIHVIYISTISSTSRAQERKAATKSERFHGDKNEYVGVHVVIACVPVAQELVLRVQRRPPPCRERVSCVYICERVSEKERWEEGEMC